MRREICLAVVVVAICDLLFAQVFKLLAAPPIQEQERLYRVKSDIYHHDLAKNAEKQGVWGDLTYPIFTNSLGFKDRRVREVPLESEDWRILFIGDSFTEGVGLRYEDTFVGLLDDAFGERNIRTLNAGVGSYAPSIYYRKVKYLLEDVGLDFDELVVFVDISDIDDEAHRYDVDANDHVVEPVRAPASFAWRTFLKENSIIIRLAVLVRDRVLNATADQEEMRRQRNELQRAGWTIDQNRFDAYGLCGLERSVQHMNQLLGVLRRHGVPLTVVVYPWPVQIIGGDLDSVHVRTWRAWSEQNGVQFINLFPEFFERDPRDVVQDYYIPSDVHLNEQGNALVAKAFLEHFVSARDRPPPNGQPEVEQAVKWCV